MSFMFTRKLFDNVLKLNTFGFSLLLLLLTCGSLIINYTPFHDDLLLLVTPFSLNGLNYLANDNLLFIRPVEYYVFALASSIRLEGLPVLVNFIIISFTVVYSIKIISASYSDFDRKLSFLLVSFFVLSPVIASSAFQIDTLSQCLSNFCAVFLLWATISKKTNHFSIIFISVLGLLSKESFLPFLLTYIALQIFQKRKTLPIILFTLVLFYFIVRSNIISPNNIVDSERYNLSAGLNVLSNISLHFAGLFYLGSSPDLYVKNLLREFPAIVGSIILFCSFTWALISSKWTSKKLTILLFASISLVPGIFMSAVSEHNVSAFVWFGLIFICYVFIEIFNQKLVITLLLMSSLLAGFSVLRKASLLQATMNDFKRMSIEFRESKSVTCSRFFQKPFSFYFFNSEKHIQFISPNLKSIKCSV